MKSGSDRVSNLSCARAPAALLLTNVRGQQGVSSLRLSVCVCGYQRVVPLMFP